MDLSQLPPFVKEICVYHRYQRYQIPMTPENLSPSIEAIVLPDGTLLSLSDAEGIIDEHGVMKIRRQWPATTGGVLKQLRVSKAEAVL